MRIDLLKSMDIIEYTYQTSMHRLGKIQIKCRALILLELDFYNSYYILFDKGISVFFYCSHLEHRLDSGIFFIILKGNILRINYDYKLELNSHIGFYLLTTPCRLCIDFMKLFPEDCYDTKLNEIKMEEGPPLLL